MLDHRDRADILTFDLKDRAEGRTRLDPAVGTGPGMAYVPAADLLMHAYAIALPFVKPQLHAQPIGAVGVSFLTAV